MAGAGSQRQMISGASFRGLLFLLAAIELFSSCSSEQPVPSALASGMAKESGAGQTTTGEQPETSPVPAAPPGTPVATVPALPSSAASPSTDHSIPPSPDPPATTASATTLVSPPTAAASPSKVTGDPGLYAAPLAPVARGGMLTVRAKTAPGLLCTVLVVSNRTGPIAPRPPAISDGAGNVTWTWRVETAEPAGLAEVRVGCGPHTVAVPVTIT